MKKDSSTDYRPRLSAELTPESAKRLREILPHSYQRPLFQALVDGVIALYDRGGLEAIAVITAKHIEITSIVDIGLEQD